PEESIHGAQVFYYQHSTESKTIAEYLQKSMIAHCDPDNTRNTKADTSYYLLKNTEVPIVIAECGFLSNYEEAEKLLTEAYQDKIAYAICQGVLAYLNGKNPSTTAGDITTSVY
ncbi:MAG: N-acetylmuramoyl-L-alanine amidase, partial [Peptococcaceae bacterium]|nr:N-acetylmuramoyl-L-alanine amidase [Peptococcaceae bacterium]